MTAPGSFTALLGGDAPVEAGLEGSSARSRFTRPAVTLPAVVLLLAAVLAVVFVDRDPKGPGPGEAIVQVDGSARLVRASGAASTVTGSLRLEPGDRLALRSGTASFELAEGVRYEGRGRSEKRAGTALKMGKVPALEAGSLLVTTVAQPASLRSGSARAVVGAGGAARLDRSLALTLGGYRGQARLESAGRERRIAALRTAEAVGNGEVTRSRPLRYSADDAWDRRFLPDAVYLDGQLDPLERGVASSGLRSADLLEAVRAKIDDRPSRARLAAMAEDRKVDIDLAVGLAVVGSGGPGASLGSRFSRGFGFHDDGATWGLVAMDLGADPTAVMALLRGALDGRSLAGALDLTGLARTQAGIDGTAATGSIGGIDGASTGPGIAPATGAIAAGGGSTPGANGPDGGNPPTGGGTGVTLPGTPGVTVPGVPSVTVPPITLPPVKLPPVTLPPVTLPPVLVPPIVVTLPGGTTITTPPVTTPPILGPILGGVNGTVGGVTGTVNGTVGGVTGTVGGVTGGLGGLLGH